MTASQAFEQAGRCHREGKLDEAIAGYQAAVTLDDRFHPAWYAQGCAFETKGNHARAVDCFEQAVSLAPGHAESRHNLGNSLFNLGLIDEALACFAKAIELGAGFVSRTAIATVIPGSPLADNQAVLKARRNWADTHLPSAERRRPGEPVPGPRRLRVGYLSSFFAREQWMSPVWGLINAHYRRQIEVHLFSDAPQKECVGYRPHLLDRFHDITSLSNQAAAERIREAQLDLLIDLNGYSRIDRLAVLALRPAPVQAGWFNYYATSGLSSCDYLIGDNEVIPSSEECYYCEKIVRVPGSYLTFQPPEDMPDVAEPPFTRAGHLTFGCLASSYKLTHPVINCWSLILRGVPYSKLFLKNTSLRFEENRNFLLRRFARHGIGPDRIIMEGPAAHTEFVTAYRNVDIALDTFPYNGGTTTIEALWQGVPVLTFYGDRWAARQGASLLRAAGLPEFVASSMDDYVARAMALGLDRSTPALLGRLRQDLRARISHSPVCDTVAMAGEVERLYQKMTSQV